MKKYFSTLLFMFVLLCLFGCQPGKQYSFEDYVQALERMEKEINDQSKNIAKGDSGSYAVRRGEGNGNILVIPQGHMFNQKPFARLMTDSKRKTYTLFIQEERMDKLVGKQTFIKVYVDFAGSPMFHIHSYKNGIKIQRRLKDIEKMRKRQFYEILKKLTYSK